MNTLWCLTFFSHSFFYRFLILYTSNLRWSTLPRVPKPHLTLFENGERSRSHHPYLASPTQSLAFTPNPGIPLCHTEWHLALGIMVKADTTDGQNPGWMRSPEQGSPHLCRRPLQPLSGDSWCLRDEPWATESQLFVCSCALIISNSTSPAAIWQITAAIKSVLHQERGTADGLAFVFLLWCWDRRRTGRKVEVGGITSLQGKCHCILVRQAEAETAHQLKPSRKAQLGDNQVDLEQWFLIAWF